MNTSQTVIISLNNQTNTYEFDEKVNLAFTPSKVIVKEISYVPTYEEKHLYKNDNGDEAIPYQFVEVKITVDRLSHFIYSSLINGYIGCAVPNGVSNPNTTFRLSQNPYTIRFRIDDDTNGTVSTTFKGKINITMEFLS